MLTEAREAEPGNLEVMARLAQLALREDRLSAVREIAAALDVMVERGEETGVLSEGLALEAAEGTAAARNGARAARAAELSRSLRTALLLRENRREEGLALLEEQAGRAGGDMRSVLALVRARLAAGETEQARLYLDGLRAEAPEDGQLQLIDAALLAAEGDAEGSEAMVRDLVARDPGDEAAVQMLYRQIRQAGRDEEAAAVLEAGYAASKGDGTDAGSRALGLLQAGELERAGDYEGAVAIYEALYAADSADVVVANNLASMLSTYLDDDESLARASAVAQRLRGSNVPAFQDTYGWIAYRRGELSEAVDALEPAARALGRNALVQYHLGMAYAGLGRDREAVATLERALALGEGSALPQMEAARAALEEAAARVALAEEAEAEEAARVEARSEAQSEARSEAEAEAEAEAQSEAEAEPAPAD